MLDHFGCPLSRIVIGVQLSSRHHMRRSLDYIGFLLLFHRRHRGNDEKKRKVVSVMNRDGLVSR